VVEDEASEETGGWFGLVVSAEETSSNAESLLAFSDPSSFELFRIGVQTLLATPRPSVATGANNPGGDDGIGEDVVSSSAFFGATTHDIDAGITARCDEEQALLSLSFVKESL